MLAFSTLQFQHDLLSGFCFFPENRLRLPSEALLLAVVAPPPLSLRRLLALLVLRNFVQGVLAALSAWAKSIFSFGNVNLKEYADKQTNK